MNSTFKNFGGGGENRKEPETGSFLFLWQALPPPSTNIFLEN